MLLDIGACGKVREGARLEKATGRAKVRAWPR
jgi:hypothetical protein